MKLKFKECDLRSWLEKDNEEAAPYTAKRIHESYAFIERILAECPGIKYGSAWDVGSGAGLNSFALGAYFDHVLAIDTNEQAISEAREIAERAKVSSIAFECADIERFHSHSQVDFILCNLMSHNVQSRRVLVEIIAKALSKGGWLFYAEATEGYGPLEIHRAIARRDEYEMVSRLQQVIRGFVGNSGFRFFVSGTMWPHLESLGLKVVSRETSNWNGVAFGEQILCQKVDTGAEMVSHVDNVDYWQLPSDFASVRTWFIDFISARRPSGFTRRQREKIYMLALDTPNPYAPFLLFVLMVDKIIKKVPLPLRYFLPPRLTRPEHRGFALFQKIGVGLSEVDWHELAELDRTFINLMRQYAGLKQEPIDD